MRTDLPAAGNRTDARGVMEPSMSPPRARFPSSLRRPALASALIALLGCAGAARGEASPYTIGVSETYSHESNLVRLPDEAPLPAALYAKTDWIASTALFGGIDQPIGRQRVYLNATLRDNHFRYNSVYNNLGFGLAGGLDWSTADRVSGNVTLSSNRNLASFNRNTANNAPDVVKNIERTDVFGLTARVGVVTDVTIEGGLTHQSKRFSETGANLDLQQDVLSLATRYRIGGELTLGAGLRYTDGRYPENDDSFKGTNVDVTANWVPNAVSTLDARLSVGNSRHSLATAQDFSGATGALSWRWRPTAKLSFNTTLSRDTGTDSSFESGTTIFGTPVTANADNSRLTTGLGVDASYAATAKIQVDASYKRSARKLTNSLAINAGLPASTTDADTLTQTRLGARWAPTRTMQFDCSIAHESRSADNASLTYAYHANTVACSGQFALQF
jgi:hypothetical protein